MDEAAPRLVDDSEAAQWAADHGLAVTLGVGDCGLRERMLDVLGEWLSDARGVLMPLIDPTATLAQDARLGAAVQVFAHAHVGPGAFVGDGSLINTGAVVEHDASVGRASHVAPRAVLLGGATIGDRTLVGAGTVVSTGICVGDHVTVGAGSVVIRDHLAAGTIVGSPARTVGA